MAQNTRQGLAVYSAPALKGWTFAVRRDFLKRRDFRARRGVCRSQGVHDVGCIHRFSRCLRRTRLDGRFEVCAMLRCSRWHDLSRRQQLAGYCSAAAPRRASSMHHRAGVGSRPDQELEFRRLVRHARPRLGDRSVSSPEPPRDRLMSATPRQSVQGGPRRTRIAAGPRRGDSCEDASFPTDLCIHPEGAMNSVGRPIQRRLVGTDGPSVEALLDQRVAVVVLSRMSTIAPAVRSTHRSYHQTDSRRRRWCVGCLSFRRRDRTRIRPPRRRFRGRMHLQISQWRSGIINRSSTSQKFIRAAARHPCRAGEDMRRRLPSIATLRRCRHQALSLRYAADHLAARRLMLRSMHWKASNWQRCGRKASR